MATFGATDSATTTTGLNNVPPPDGNETDAAQFDSEVQLAQMRPSEGAGFINDFNQAVYDAGTQLIDQLPPSVQGAANLLRNTPNDVVIVGNVADIPGLGKVGFFLLQPSSRTNPLIPANPFGPDGQAFTNDDVKPIVFFSIPSRNIVGTYNPNNNQVEFGPGAASPIAPQTLFFYNQRTGGRGGGAGNSGGVGSVSVNFGFLNSTFSDPIMDYGIDKASQGVTAIARALQGAGLLGDAVTGPSGEGLVGAAAIEAFRAAAIHSFNQRTTWFVGVGWRGADLERYNNGETILNFSGAKFRLSEGDQPGGSGLPSDAFIFDAGTFSQGLGFDPNRILPTDDAIAQRLGSILYRSYVEGDQSPQDAYNWTVGAYQDGGKAGLSQQAIEVLGINTPNSVNDRAFVRMGMGEQAASLAKGIYDQLRSDQTEYYSPREAWTTVWANYLNGNPSVSNSGLRNGGDAGGMTALRDLAYRVGLDATPYLPRELR